MAFMGISNTNHAGVHANPHFANHMGPGELVAEANHRAANSLALLGGLVRMQARAAGKSGQHFSHAQVQMMLDGVAARIATIGQLHRMLANMPLEGSVPLNQHLREVCSTVITAFSSEEQPVHINHHGVDCLVLTKYVQPLTLMLCEIIINAMKYSHPAGGVPIEIVVRCHSETDGTLKVTVSDDGVGLPEGFDPAKDGGLGFQVIRALAREIGAELDIRSDNLGVTFSLTVPQALVANVKTA